MHCNFSYDFNLILFGFFSGIKSNETIIRSSFVEKGLSRDKDMMEKELCLPHLDCELPQGQ